MVQHRVAEVVSYTAGSIGMAVGIWFLDNWLQALSALAIVATFGMNWFYRHHKHRRELKEHNYRIKQLEKED